jgi:serine/threonine-protein kinase
MSEATAARPADRNLLFGILALQMDFIDRDALVGAMNAWVLAKNKPLGQILLEQGKLSPEHLQLLDAMVTAHVRAHGNDPHKSLAVLSSVSPVRKDLQALADPDVQASVARAGSATVDADATGAYVLRTAAGVAAVERYRILRPHARGGLGEIFVAEDQELHREVALKEIQADQARDAVSKARFVLEAEITGGLEHPGIVPVYGLGQYADGRPFYAMRFIKGDNLKEAIKRFHQKPVSEGRESPVPPSERNLEFRQLLRRFIDVCNAIAYAHSRGVLHRDLKPGNIMLGKFGETLIIDWGLAKAAGRAESATPSAEAPFRPSSGSGQAATVMGAALGTPAYMSPEQATGRLDLLGPATDVYGLGATLYAVLTGRAPFRDEEAAEVLLRVQRGDFPAPRKINPAVPAALEAICLKAMALRPEDRYRGPDEVATEIEHWLADEPVQAFSEPWRARAGRWARRHRTLVSTVAAAFLVAAVGLLAATVLLSVANRRERDLKEVAQQREREAQEQRDQARANFKLARQAVDEYCTKVGKDVRLKDQDLSELRRQLLDTAVRFYKRFVDEHGEDPDLQLELGKAYRQLASLESELDRLQEAAVLARRSAQVLRQLAAAKPDEPDYRYELASSLLALASPVQVVENYAASAQLFQEARDYLETLAQSHPNDLKYALKLATVYGNQGEAVRHQRELQAAEDWIRKAINILEKLRPQFPDDDDLLTSLAVNYRNLANTLRMGRKTKDGIAAAQSALQLWSGRAEANPKDPYFRQHQGVTLHILALLYMQAGDFDAADKSLRQVVEIHKDMVDRYPSIVSHQESLVLSYGNYASLLEQIRRPEQALETLRLSLPIQEKLVAQDSRLPHRRETLVGHLAYLGRLYVRTRQEAQAYAAWRQAVAHLEHLECNTPSAAEVHSDVANCLNLMAQGLLGKGDIAGAIEQTRRELSIREKLAARDKPLPADSYSLGAAQGRLATYLNRANKREEARSWAEKSARTWDRALEKASGAEKSFCRLQRAAAVALSGDHRRAAAEADDLVKIPRLRGPALYDLACVFALSSAAAGKDPKLAEAERSRLADDNANKAMAALRQAVQNGYKDAAHIQTDTDLDVLRHRDDFKKLLAELQGKGKGAGE